MTPPLEIALRIIAICINTLAVYQSEMAKQGIVIKDSQHYARFEQSFVNLFFAILAIADPNITEDQAAALIDQAFKDQ